MFDICIINIYHMFSIQIKDVLIMMGIFLEQIFIGAMSILGVSSLVLIFRFLWKI